MHYFCIDLIFFIVKIPLFYKEFRTFANIPL
nr:MAG TPA: hypothetical protein [Caudoviricetes sp.]